MCVPKKDRGWRPVIDYRNINNVTFRENWNITWANEAYDALAKAKFMAVVNCTSGYWQIPLSPESKKYTAFTTSLGMAIHFSPYGNYQCSPYISKKYGSNANRIVMKLLYCLHRWYYDL